MAKWQRQGINSRHGHGADRGGGARYDRQTDLGEKEIGQGNDARRTLVRAQTTDYLRTLKQHFDKFILIDDYLRKQAKALGVKSHLVNPAKVEEQGVMYADDQIS